MTYAVQPTDRAAREWVATLYSEGDIDAATYRRLMRHLNIKRAVAWLLVTPVLATEVGVFLSGIAVIVVLAASVPR